MREWLPGQRCVIRRKPSFAKASERIPLRVLEGGQSCEAQSAKHDGGQGGIRTLDTVTRMPHFECGAFNHSTTCPKGPDHTQGPPPPQAGLPTAFVSAGEHRRETLF